MKKDEAKLVALEKSKLIIEYITQILSDTEKVNAIMNFHSRRIDTQLMCILDIYVPKRKFEKHLNLEITSDHYLVLCEQLLNDLLDTFLEHETMGVTKYYSIKSQAKNFSGINAINILGSNIEINFNGSGQEFMNLISKYEKRYDDFVLEISNPEKIPKKR